ncbi:MAG: 3-isopropylmalate dehydratase small subunit [Candidatus Margulisiibacteriota bacterium]|jgi:3-isopropylmalate/(R)-2-methylmalate dehydratase small subunit
MQRIIKNIKSCAVIIKGDDLDTDQILPAKFMKEITFDNMGKYLFYDYRYDESKNTRNFVLDQPEFIGAEIMIVGKNFGCGSSREHAPQAIKRAGFKAIIGESFAEIFTGNCKALGIPLVTMVKEKLSLLTEKIGANPQILVELDLENKMVTAADLNLPIEIKDSFREAFLKGIWDASLLLKDNLDLILKKDQTLYY